MEPPNKDPFAPEHASSDLSMLSSYVKKQTLENLVSQNHEIQQLQSKALQKTQKVCQSDPIPKSIVLQEKSPVGPQDVTLSAPASHQNGTKVFSQYLKMVLQEPEKQRKAPSRKKLEALSMALPKGVSSF